jgi:hypothetical protein
MVYNAQSYWDSGLCSASGILKKKKIENTTFQKLDLFQFSCEGKKKKTPTLLGPLERANPNDETAPLPTSSNSEHL